mgnify:CR=1 FL=1
MLVGSSNTSKMQDEIYASLNINKKVLGVRALTKHK